MKTQAAMELQANKKRKEVDFTVGDSVYVSKKGFTTPARNLKNSSTLLETFHKDYPDAAGPPLRLAHCIRAAATDEYDDDHPDDDKAAHGARGVGRSHATRHKWTNFNRRSWPDRILPKRTRRR